MAQAADDTADDGAAVDPDVSEILDVCLRTGELLLSNGAGAADVAVTMDSLARHFGLRNAEIDITFTSLTMAHRSTAAVGSFSLIRQVKQRTIDFDDLTTADAMVGAILRDEVSLGAARDQLARIGSSARHRRRWAVTAGWGAMCAGVALMLGGNLAVVVVATVAAMTIERMQVALKRRRLPAFYTQVSGGLVAMIFAVAVSYAGLTPNPSLVVSANIVMLLSGIGFMGALQDALSGYYLTATARLLEALLATAGIIAGVTAGLAAAQLVDAPIGTLTAGTFDALSLIVLGLGATLAAAGFAFASRSRKRVLLPIGALAGLAIVISRLVELAGLGRMLSVALAAFLVGLVSYPLARRLRVPPLVIVISSVVPMLPGLTIYQGLTLLAVEVANGGPTGPASLGGNVGEGILAMVVAASVALSLAAGVILGEYVAQPLSTEARRLERRLSGPRLVGPIRWQSVRRPGRGRSGSGGGS